MRRWRQAELRNPDTAEVHRIAGLLEYDRNHPDQALARMRRATEFQPPHRDAYRRLGQLYQLSGQLPEALQAYLKARGIAPGDARIYQDLARVYSVQSKFAEAAKALQRAVELAPDRPLYRRSLAAAYQDQGQFSEAEAALRTVLAQERSPDTLSALGHVLMYQKRDAEAVSLLSEAARLDGQNAFTWLRLGLASQRLGRAAEARRAFQNGLTVAERQVVHRPSSGYYHATLAYFCAQTGQSGRAGMEASQAVQLAPRHNDTLWLATLTYERIGNRTTALKTLESAPRSLMEDTRRWPEASALTSDVGFSQLLPAPGEPRWQNEETLSEEKEMSPVTTTRTLSFKVHRQEKSEWCWAAVSVGVNRFFRPDSSFAPGLPGNRLRPRSTPPLHRSAIEPRRRLR